MKKLSFFLLCFLLFISSYSQNKPTLSDKNSFSMILLPDPQSYTKFDTNQPIFELMTAWVATPDVPEAETKVFASALERELKKGNGK